MESTSKANSVGADVVMPVGILIDSSSAVYGEEHQINQWLRILLQQMRDDPELNRVVRLLTIHYNHKVCPVAEFLPLEQICDQDQVVCDSCGATDIGGALLYGLRRMMEQIEDWADAGGEILCPIIILLCGEFPAPAFDAPDDELLHFWKKYGLASRRFNVLMEENSLIFAVFMSDHAYCFCSSERCRRAMYLLTRNAQQLFIPASAEEISLQFGSLFSLAQSAPHAAVSKNVYDAALGQVWDL